MKFCKDCRHYGKGAVCNAPKNLKKKMDVVTGQEVVERKWRYCINHRRHYGFIYVIISSQCGRRGRWFEPKE